MLVLARWTRSLGGKRSLAHARNDSSGALVDLLLAEGHQPHLAAQAGAEGRGEGAQAVGAVVVVQHVLRDLVDHQEQRRRAAGRRNLSMSPIALTASSGDSLRTWVPARLVYQLIGSV
jgi:hypothetical protein